MRHKSQRHVFPPSELTLNEREAVTLHQALNIKQNPYIFSAKFGRKIGVEKGGFWAFYLQRTIKVRTFVLAIENQARRFRESTKTK